MMTDVVRRAPIDPQDLRIRAVEPAACAGMHASLASPNAGTRRAYALRAGEYADVHAMERLHPRPPQLPALVKE